uniref:Putative ovule protein n=1 Tax=Solanum chacoense TaxID=4108 RepID=A0A0V0HTE0_SOLCH
MTSAGGFINAGLCFKTEVLLVFLHYLFFLKARTVSDSNGTKSKNIYWSIRNVKPAVVLATNLLPYCA